MSNLELSQKVDDLIKALDRLEGEITPEVEQLTLDISRSADLAGQFLDKSKFQIDYLEFMKKRYVAKIEKIEASQKRIEAELRKAIKTLGPVVGGEYVFELHKNKYETIIDDKTKLHENYLTTTITHVPSKTAIKEAILAGHRVDGARLEQSLKKTFNATKIKDV